MNTISATPSVQTYSSLGQIKSQPLESSTGSSFLDMVKQPLQSALHQSRAHEAAAVGAAQGKISSLELLQATTSADLAVQEFKAYWDKVISAMNDITKTNI